MNERQGAGREERGRYNEQNEPREQRWGERYRGARRRYQDDDDRARGFSGGRGDYDVDNDEGNDWGDRPTYSEYDYQLGDEGRFSRSSQAGNDWNDWSARAEQQRRDRRFGGQRGFEQGEYGQSGRGGYGQERYRGQGGSQETGRRSFGQASGYGQGGFRESSSGRGAYGESSRYGRQSGLGQSGAYGQGYGGRGEYESSSRWSHRGKGPKGYRRSPERLKEILCEKLQDDPEIDASEVSIDVSGETVTLEGTVDSRLTKYAIEECAEQCGASVINNHLRIGQEGSDDSESRQSRQWTSGQSGEKQGENRTGKRSS